MKQKTDRRKNLKCVAFWIEPTIFQGFKMLLAKTGISMQDWGRRALTRDLEKHGLDK